MTYRTAQDQMNDVMAFGMWLVFMGVIFGLVKQIVTNAMKPESPLEVLPETKRHYEAGQRVLVTLAGREQPARIVRTVIEGPFKRYIIRTNEGREVKVSLGQLHLHQTQPLGAYQYHVRMPVTYRQASTSAGRRYVRERMSEVRRRILERCPDAVMKSGFVIGTLDVKCSKPLTARDLGRGIEITSWASTALAQTQRQRTLGELFEAREFHSLTRGEMLRLAREATLREGFTWDKASEERTARLHRQTVEAAIREGVPVPEVVLRDYPELAAPGRLPQVLIEGGEPVPPPYRYLVGWIDEPLPEYSLQVSLLPQVEAKERKIDAVLQQLKSGVETIQQSEVFRQFLITMSKFHDYSIGNQILIMLQKPDATKVAGFNTWKELGRWVKRGERGISILAPVFPVRETIWQRRDGTEWTVRRVNREWGVYITRTAEGHEPNTLLDDFDTKGEAERQVREWGGRRVVVEEPRPYEARHFKVVYVFDISQTEGKPLPEFEVPVLTGEVNEKLFSKVLELTKKQGIAVSFESRPELPPEIKGQYLAPNRIWVRPEEPRAQQLKTLLHESAHYYSEGVFHIPRRDAETIAESAAFVVGAHHGFDTGVRSFPYVALWAQDKKVLEENLGAVRRVATTMLEGLET